MRMIHRGRVSAAISLVLLVGRLSQAGGTDVINQGARGAGQAEAFAAQADDPSAIYYNPAGLTQLRGTNLQAGAYLILPQWTFEGDNGTSESMRLPSLLPHFYAESDFGLDRWRFGLGLNNVFGMNEDWGDKGPLRTLSDKAMMSVLNFAPTVAYSVNDHLSLGLALNAYYGELSVRRNVVLGPPPTPEGTFHFRGYDLAVGVTPGIMWKIDDRNTIGGFYRSPFTLDFDGKARVSAKGIPTIGPADSHTALDFPQSAGIAYAVRPIQPLKLEADVVWTDWDVAKSSTLHSTNSNFNGMKTIDNWKSGFSFRFGTQYDLTRNWALRAGYAYGQNAIPTSTFSPLVPDSNYHLFSVGIGYAGEHWGADFAYQFIYRETRNIHDNLYSPITDGSWSNVMNNFMVSVSYRL